MKGGVAVASEQRAEERRERKREKDRKTRRIVWIVLAVLVVIIIVMKLCEIDYNQMKSVLSGGTQAVSDKLDGDFPYTLDSSDKVSVQKQGSRLAVLTSSSVSVLDPGDANVEFTAVHGYANPIMKVSDSYLVTFDQGGKKLRLDYSGENLYEINSKTSVLCADVADNGNVAYATTSEEKRSDVYILSKTQDEKLKYSVSYGFVTNIAVSDNGKKVAFLAMNSQDAKLMSKLYLMNAGDSEPYAEFDISGSTILDIEFDSNKLFVIGNDFLSVVSGDDMKSVIKQGSMNTVCFDYMPGGELVLAYNTYNNSTSNSIVRVSSSGSVKSTISVDGTIKDISCSSSEVSVLFSDSIVTYKLSSAEQVSKIECTDLVRSITRMSSSLFVQSQSLLDKEDA